MNKAYYVKLQPVFENSLRNKLLLLQACTEIINNELFRLSHTRNEILEEWGDEDSTFI